MPPKSAGSDDKRSAERHQVGCHRSPLLQKSFVAQFKSQKWNEIITWSTTCRLRRGVSSVSWVVGRMTYICEVTCAEATDYSATGPIKFIERFFRNHVRLRCDGERATVALANKVKHMAGELVKFETTTKHNSASTPAERAIQAVEEQTRTIRADCQMRFGNGEALGADKPIWAWLLRHAGWQISRYKQKGNGKRAYKQAYDEHYTHEVVPFAEFILVRIPKPTHRALQGGKRWHKGDAVLIKGVWVGRSETSDEHIVLTPGGRVLSRKFDDRNRLVDMMLDFWVR